MLKKAIDRLSDQKLIADDTSKIREIENRYEEFIKLLTNININSNRIQNFINHRYSTIDASDEDFFRETIITIR